MEREALGKSGGWQVRSYYRLIESRRLNEQEAAAAIRQHSMIIECTIGVFFVIILAVGVYLWLSRSSVSSGEQDCGVEWRRELTVGTTAGGGTASTSTITGTAGETTEGEVSPNVGTATSAPPGMPVRVPSDREKGFAELRYRKAR